MKRRAALLLVLLLAAAGTFVLTGFRTSRDYKGYFDDFSMPRLFDRVANAPQIRGTGGGGSGGSNGPYVYSRTHDLVGERPITEDLLQQIQTRVMEDLKSRGVRVLREKNVPGGDANYPAARIRLTTWGFQVLFDDHGWKGTFTVRLMVKEIPEPSLGHLADLWENIVIFPRD